MVRQWNFAGERQLLQGNMQFRRLFYAALISGMGDWINSVAVLVLVLELTHSPTAVGITLAMRVLPHLFMGPLGGVWTDRIRRTWMMIGSDLMRFVIALGFLLIQDVSQMWGVYALTAFLVVFSALFVPARTAYVTSIVRTEEIGRANALLEVTNGLVMVMGFALGGLIVANLGVSAAFVLNALSFLASACFLLKPAIQEPPSVQMNVTVPTFREDFLLGLESMRSNKIVLTLLLLMLGWAVGGGAFNVLLSVMATDVYQSDSFGLGMLYASIGGGTVAGSILIAKHSDLSLRKIKVLAGCSFVADSLLHILFANTDSFLWGCLTLLGVGMAGALGNTAIVTLIAKTTPEDLQGRVFSITNSLSSSVLALSMVAAGLLVPVIGPRLSGTLGGGLIFLFSLSYSALILAESRKDVIRRDTHAA
ncbi:MFS transporter [Effusibacillus lacus]|uniref:MFS transporter n=1 Tax=Effusibacillus lacus TaxID=1348429 RepID=A0A292YIQ5_9BACL|nr:MFS transporter [Effusibacillus lacus]TCS74324.1 putative MFS family arabinose efflux permease [Effusibacillus lacus]GAX88781.1 MFS transporter [Effusibacillus lacus]